MYEIIYDYSNDYADEYNLRETFEGTWDELIHYIEGMKESGCYNIMATGYDDCEEA